jgi:hypothetical protein
MASLLIVLIVSLWMAADHKKAGAVDAAPGGEKI